ncbi:MAG: lipoyl(octanoyl) transferase LipB [Propionibacterium sp.]|jgi:lipoyl(octanoyl) transferase|uniref:Octanoyltransferase n=1 Tax=Brooklawnia propionicigenes TaxID=3041175 RepID=A0AAN0K7M9_9ACTN|nr:lipoyl(octanoyl) transferase LipB [Brooklawnia sp. SH051]MEA5121496.1 lipoyl(octanoyl) transferase LipB [Propionibacterium sp.]NLI86154.1 lipoyl(octanoyl) transferase LipB [Propionibacterium sp.]BEH03168.1 lipoyl(octanoyl) transferase LipB [Brooklawnia sp. SH051]
MALHFERLGFNPDFVDYRACLDLQQQVHDEVLAGTRGNSVLLLEHDPVYTAGRRAEASEYPYDGTPVVPIGRGGKITYHGPGMLVGYPIVRLAVPIQPVKMVRLLEQIIIAVVADFGVQAGTVEGRSGAWVRADSRGPDRKLAAIGLQVSRKVTMHGFALNCSNDLRPFGKIIPCGISDAGVTSISQEVSREVKPADVVERMELELASLENAGIIDSFEPATAAAPLDLSGLHGLSHAAN